MSAIELPLLPSLLAACLVLVVGGFLAQRVPLLGRYSIPAPIIGGLLFAVLAVLAKRLSGLAVTFDTSAKTPFLLLFFASIGLTADLVLLRRGGVRLLRFLIALFPFLLVQNALGLAIARLLGLRRTMLLLLYRKHPDDAALGHVVTDKVTLRQRVLDALGIDAPA